MTLNEMRESTLEELNEHERELRRELFNLRFQKVIGGLENPARIKLVKREIARIKTVMKERGMEG